LPAQAVLRPKADVNLLGSLYVSVNFSLQNKSTRLKSYF
jgi:hypothetical protein